MIIVACQAGGAAVLGAATAHIPADAPGEPADHLCCAVLLPPPHPHVLLPVQPLILDILCTSVISPKALANSVSGDKTISFAGCITQCYFYFFQGTVEFLLLTVMSYDRYVTVCYPLRYSTIMRPPVCIATVVFSWWALAGPGLCGTTAIELMDFMLLSTVILCCMVLVAYSYTYIVLTVACIPSASGRKKAFNTCAPHLTIVVISGSIMVLSM
eukprot:bmy_21505T0